MDLFSLLKETSAYKTVLMDKTADRLSHAYLVISADGKSLGEYLKILAKTIMRNDNDVSARTGNLIDQGVHPDVLTFPKNGESVLKEDVTAIIEETFYKPIESDKKIFLINNGESMNASSQNKLLKTLEEPPKGVHIIMGATSEYPLLSTVKSRMKKLVIPPFSKEQLFNALKDDCVDEERLKEAIACGDGTVGTALALYDDDYLSDTVALAEDVFINMKSSRNVLEYSLRIAGLKDGAAEFISVLGSLCRDYMLYLNGEENAVFNKSALERIKNAEGFNRGAIIYIADRIFEAERKIAANVNPQAVVERLLFDFLEGKHKWQKL